MIDNEIEYTKEGKLILEKTKLGLVVVSLSDNIKDALDDVKMFNPELVHIVKEGMLNNSETILEDIKNIIKGKQKQ